MTARSSFTGGKTPRPRNPPAKARGRVWRAKSRIAPHDAHLPSAEPLFRKNALPSVYRIMNEGSWYYGDLMGHGRVINPLTGMRADHPHLVLSDWKKPRFVLGYHRSSAGLTVTSVQRVRTEYRLVKKLGVDKFEWLPEKELASQKKFAEQLGMRPAEFLMNEFIFAHRKAILSGTRVSLRIMVFRGGEKKRDAIYGPLIERFFKHKREEQGFPSLKMYFETYELSLEKRRVREALGLPLLKK